MLLGLIGKVGRRNLGKAEILFPVGETLLWKEGGPHRHVLKANHMDFAVLGYDQNSPQHLSRFGVAKLCAEPMHECHADGSDQLLKGRHRTVVLPCAPLRS